MAGAARAVVASRVAVPGSELSGQALHLVRVLLVMLRMVSAIDLAVLELVTGAVLKPRIKSRWPWYGAPKYSAEWWRIARAAGVVK